MSTIVDGIKEVLQGFARKDLALATRLPHQPPSLQWHRER